MIIKKIENIAGFVVQKETLVTATKDRKVFLNEVNQIELGFKVDTQHLEIWDDYFAVQGYYGETSVFHKNGSQLYTTNYTLTHNYQSLDEQILISEKTDRIMFRKFHLFDLSAQKGVKSGTVAFEVFQSLYYFPNLFIFNKNDLKITNLHLPTETTLWQYDISVLGVERVEKIFGVFGKVLVVLGQKASESTGSGVPNLPIIFGISTESGELLWKQDEAFLHGYDVPYSVYTPLLEPQTGRVVIFSNGLYTEIDATSGEIILWKNLHENPLSASGHTMDRFCFDPSQVDETYIYFRTGIGHSSNRTGLGVFNRKLQQLESLEILKDEKGKPVSMGPQRIQATKDKIYALDLKNTLHIFERD